MCGVCVWGEGEGGGGQKWVNLTSDEDWLVCPFLFVFIHSFQGLKLFGAPETRCALLTDELTSACR